MANLINNADNVYICTNPQGSPEWLNDRVGKITGSVIGSLMNYCKTEEKKNEQADIICGLKKVVFSPESMEKVAFGTRNEDLIRQDFEEQFDHVVIELGLCNLIEDVMIFGTSVDGVLENKELLEIKTTSKEHPLKKYPDFSEINEGHMYQMQNGMAILGAKYCHYYSYSRVSKTTYHRKVPFIPKIWDKIREFCVPYWHLYIKPRLIAIGKISVSFRVLSNVRLLLIDENQGRTENINKDKSKISIS